MGIVLKTPRQNFRTYEFEISASNQIQITSIPAGNKFCYRLEAIKDLYLWLKNEKKGEWVYLGAKNETEVPTPGTVEEWARSLDDPLNRFYGVTPGLKGRFATFVPPILEYMGLVEIEHNHINNRIRAITEVSGQVSTRHNLP